MVNVLFHEEYRGKYAWNAPRDGSRIALDPEVKALVGSLAFEGGMMQKRNGAMLPHVDDLFDQAWVAGEEEKSYDYDRILTLITEDYIWEERLRGNKKPRLE